MAETCLGHVPAVSKTSSCKPLSFLTWTVEPPSIRGTVLVPRCVLAQATHGSLVWVSLGGA